MDESWGLLDRVDVEDRVIAARLDRAIDADELSVHYQPVLDLGTGERRLEALSRWPLSSTEGYVGAAERMGTIARHDLHVLSLVARDHARWAGSGRRQRISVNFSAITMTTPGIARHVARRLEDEHVDPADITIEITETVQVDPDDLVGAVHELRAVGVPASLDDFGAHFSRLGLLSQVPLAELKIDRSFVHLHERGRTTAVVAAVVGLAHELGLRVVAEGVETRAQAAWARMVGCDSVQGFLYARPSPWCVLDAAVAEPMPETG